MNTLCIYPRFYEDFSPYANINPSRFRTFRRLRKAETLRICPDHHHHHHHHHVILDFRSLAPPAATLRHLSRCFFRSADGADPLSWKSSPDKMENITTWSPCLFLSCVILPSFFASPVISLPSHTAASPDFIRQSVRNGVSTSHERSASDPHQVHISLVGEDQMRVSWITEGEAPSIVEYGMESGRYDSTIKGDNMRYKYMMYTSGMIHNVVIGPLKPSTTYYYRCSQRGPEFSMRTPPSTFPIEFAIVGDLGQTEWTRLTLEHIGNKDYDVFLLPGDLSYADFLQERWDSFGRWVEPYASQRPWMVTEGNHEIEMIPIVVSDRFRAYNARWRMPYQESGSNSNLYYSFNMAGAHVIMLGSYTDYDINSDQYKWLQADLANIDRTKTPWILVALHAPWYNSNNAHRGEGEGMRKAMEDLLYNARVDVVFAGHVHAYERFTRIYNNQPDPCGPVYITIGGGGNREGLASSFKEPPPSISVYREASFGHGRLRLLDRKSAHWSWYRNDDPESVAADEVWIDNLSSSTKCSLPTTPTKSSHDLP